MIQAVCFLALAGSVMALPTSNSSNSTALDLSNNWLFSLFPDNCTSGGTSIRGDSTSWHCQSPGNDYYSVWAIDATSPVKPLWYIELFANVYCLGEPVGRIDKDSKKGCHLPGSQIQGYLVQKQKALGPPAPANLSATSPVTSPIPRAVARGAHLVSRGSGDSQYAITKDKTEVSDANSWTFALHDHENCDGRPFFVYGNGSLACRNTSTIANNIVSWMEAPYTIDPDHVEFFWAEEQCHGDIIHRLSNKTSAGTCFHPGPAAKSWAVASQRSSSAASGS
ncbi:hypothetical protein SCUP234_02008 [Seiridium cupressi]